MSRAWARLHDLTYGPFGLAQGSVHGARESRLVIGVGACGMPAVKQLVEEATSLLTRAGSLSPQLDAEVLLGDVLKRGRVWLYAHGEATVDGASERKFRALVARRSEGCPVAYLTGRKEFWSLELTVSPATLIPRPETEHLIEESLAVINNRAGEVSVWDVGTGCGNIAVALATSLPRVRVLATDVSPGALAVAAENVRRLRVGNRVRLLAGDLDGPLAAEQFDLIVSNPPYVSDAEWACLPRGVREFEPAEALRAGADGLSLIRRLVSVAARRLHRAGSLVFEIGSSMGEAVIELIERSGELEVVRLVKDYAGHDRVVVARLP